MVCVDLKYLLDAEENRHVALSAVCGTMYHAASLVKNWVPKHVAQCFLGFWLARDVVPGIVVSQGGEFESMFALQCEEYGIGITAVGPWLAE